MCKITKKAKALVVSDTIIDSDGMEFTITHITKYADGRLVLWAENPSLVVPGIRPVVRQTDDIVIGFSD